MIVGPTVLTVTKGNGAPARRVSSKKMNWSVAGRPWPPNSLGHPMPSQPSLPIWRTTCAPRLAALAAVAEPGPDLVGQQLGVVGAQLRAQGQLLGGLFEEHGAVPRARSGRSLQVQAAPAQNCNRFSLPIPGPGRATVGGDRDLCSDPAGRSRPDGRPGMPGPGPSSARRRALAGRWPMIMTLNTF